ncbi:ATP-binding cassette domain-containing protein, partial [Sinorhizobium meliloti]|uniref:ATP-binding cassette domain-containing protein n=1 Tax=Rhizobium meliloti TaxID=382 RepID=UPI00399A8CAA
MGDIQEPVIEVRNLRVDFPSRRGTVTALSDVSLSIRPGEILGVVGESGAGKSMTGLAIQGLLEAPGHIAGGEVWLGKRRIDTLDDRAMEKIGTFYFQVRHANKNKGFALEIFGCRSAICSSPFPIADACISFSNARCRLLRSPANS